MDGQNKGKGKQGTGPALMIGLLVLVVLVAGALGFMAWQRIERNRPVPIGEILGDLRTYDGQLVHVAGEVTGSTNLLYKWFELTDASGTITIVTERGLPTVGQTVSVDGTVSELFNLGGISKTVIMEMPERE